MKSFITFLTFVFILNYSFAQTNETRASIGGGLTFNFLDNSSGGLFDQMGGYVGLTVGGKLTNYVGYGGTLQFINQRGEADDISVQLLSLSPAFFFKLYPAKESLYLYSGFQLSYFTSIKVDGESLSDFERSDYYFIAGLGYEINDRLELVSRFSNSVLRNQFDYSVQIGLNCRMGKK